MYLKLLEEAVLEEKGEKPVNRASSTADLAISANIPESYVASSEQRMDLYRRIALIRTESDADDVLDELIAQSVALVGKPAALMNKEDKMRAIGFLSQSGAFLVTKSGDKVAKYFGISKYTLYSYIDKQQEDKQNG